MTRWRITTIAPGIALEADQEWVWLGGEGQAQYEVDVDQSPAGDAPMAGVVTGFVRFLRERGIGETIGGAVRISHAAFASLEDLDLDVLFSRVPHAPFLLELAGRGTLGTEDFRYEYRLFLGTGRVHPERLGCFFKYRERIYRADAQTFALLEAVDAFNARPPASRAGAEGLQTWAEIRGLAEGIGAQLDRYLSHERVLVPPRVGVGVEVHEDGRLSLIPEVEGLFAGALRDMFFALGDGGGVFSVDMADGDTVRIVFGEAQRRAVQQMTRVRRADRALQAEVLRDPSALFDGVAGAVALDGATFGPRVRGIGDFPFTVRPFVRGDRTGIFDDAGASEGGGPVAGLRCSYADGTVEDVPIHTPADVRELAGRVEQAVRAGQGVIEHRDKSIVLDAVFVEAIRELAARASGSRPRGDEPRAARPGRYLLIYRNEEDLEYREDMGGEGWAATPAELPASLRSQLRLHQQDGVAWLQQAWKKGRRGVLLADEMGLGKTLQILTFLARLIEDGALSASGSEGPPWNPILIVAPLVLVENETWLADAKAHFEGDGAVFRPWLVLYGDQLRRLRRRDAAGRETDSGGPALDLERLREYRLIVTNYETVVNYQHSFAQMREGWTVVVTDEAQEYKTPSTKISHALKSLDPRFRIALTGTPVETRLLDVWNIFDFLQPGVLLGAATEFASRFERPLQESEQSREHVLSQLRSSLRLDRPDRYLLRRGKERLPDLPQLILHRVPCDLSPAQAAWHRDLCARVGRAEPKASPLAIVQTLMKVYQHPALVPEYRPPTVAEALDGCPKLQRLVECLREIQAQREKALIFTRSVAMQDLLRRVLGAVFGLSVDVINGVTAQHGEPGRARESRRQMLDRFRASSGFNALVLSPDVAGIGLTVIEANHVIHYGRWWNPAREAQATARAWRIGQRRPVHVYYLIARDPEGRFVSFDERLDDLLKRRETLASDFLAPQASEETLGAELLADLTRDAGAGAPGCPPLGLDDVRQLSPHRFEALVTAIEAAQGRRVLLTPRSGDGGIDVVSFGDGQLRLISCKHSAFSGEIEPDMVAELLAACDGYRGRLHGGFMHRVSVWPVLVTNTEVNRRTRTEARARDVQVVDCGALQGLLRAYPITAAGVDGFEEARTVRLSEVIAMCRRWLSGD